MCVARVANEGMLHTAVFGKHTFSLQNCSKAFVWDGFAQL